LEAKISFELAFLRGYGGRRIVASAGEALQNTATAGGGGVMAQRSIACDVNSMALAEVTLRRLPVPAAEFERTAPPRKPKENRAIVCYECGLEGHIASECPEREEENEYA